MNRELPREASAALGRGMGGPPLDQPRPSLRGAPGGLRAHGNGPSATPGGASLGALRSCSCPSRARAKGLGKALNGLRGSGPAVEADPEAAQVAEEDLQVELRGS